MCIVLCSFGFLPDDLRTDVEDETPTDSCEAFAGYFTDKDTNTCSGLDVI